MIYPSPHLALHASEVKGMTLDSNCLLPPEIKSYFCLHVLYTVFNFFLLNLLQALKFLGLLSGSFCKYMPFLILDEHAVLSDLPVSLSSLLSDSNWGVIAESVVSFFLVSTERIHNWVRHVSWCVDVPLMQPIDESEKDMAVFLLHVMHRTCVSLKDYLPLDKQLKLANMVLA